MCICNVNNNNNNNNNNSNIYVPVTQYMHIYTCIQMLPYICHKNENNGFRT